MMAVKSLATYLASPLGTEYISSEKEPHLMVMESLQSSVHRLTCQLSNFLVFSEDPAEI